MRTEFVNDNLSILILDIFREFMKIPGNEINGLSITVNGFSDKGKVREDIDIHNKIDLALEQNNMQSINTVANTIFPVNLWNSECNRKILYERYFKILKQIKKCTQNKHGIYFERMIDFKDGFNQLEKIIEFYQTGNRRRSAFQACIWDPLRDMVNTRMRGFPCMQQLVFSCVKEELIVFAFYATQYIFEKAYGNFLGLCNLGNFLAHELGIPLSAVKCYVGVEQLSSITKSDLKFIVDSI